MVYELEQKKAEPVNIIRGIVNDFCDSIGVHRPDEMLPTPSELVHTLGLPTPEDAIPSPKEVGEQMVAKGGPPAPPSLPALPFPPTPRGALGGGTWAEAGVPRTRGVR